MTTVQQFDRQFCDVSSYAVFCFDPNGRVLTWNPGVAAILGYSREEFIGVYVRDLFTEEDRAAGVPERELKRAEQQGEAYDDRWHVTRGGRLVFVAGMVTPIRNEAGGVQGFLKIVRDRTEMLESEARLRDRGKEAEAANREKDALVAVVAHELRQPLNAILGWASMGAGGRIPQERLIEVFSRIARSTEATVRFVNDLFDVSRIAAGKLQLSMEPTNLAALVRDVTFEVAPDAASRRITLEQECPQECPITGDPIRLRQVVVNLLGNAIKFTPPHGSIRVALTRDADETVVLRVSDTGVGIAPEDLPHVFDRFRQSRRADERQAGLGLGLWLVKEIVRHHEGDVSVTSDGPGRGSVFTVRLPARAGAVEPV